MHVPRSIYIYICLSIYIYIRGICVCVLYVLYDRIDRQVLALIWIASTHGGLDDLD